MNQPTLFDAVPAEVQPPPAIPVNVTVDQREAKRLSAQSRRILERLQHSPATNSELAAMALNYRARISELRQAGYPVEVFDRDFSTGVAKYRLVQS